MRNVGKYRGLKGKRGEKLLLSIRENIAFSGISECLQIFVCCQEGDGNLMKSSLMEHESGAEKELEPN